MQTLGAIAFAIGVWGVVVGSDYDVITGNETVSAAALLLVSGIVTLSVAALGIVGACGMWRPLLVIVSAIVSVYSVWVWVWVGGWVGVGVESHFIQANVHATSKWA